MGKETYVAALDIGTTLIRCFIYDSKVQIRGSAVEQVQLLYPSPGFVEIDPDSLWQSIVRTITFAIRDAKLEPNDIECLGISTLRSTFITWDKRTGKPFHNFITWKDLRADSLVREWNQSLFLKTMNMVSYCLYLATRSKRFLAGSVLKFMNTQTTLRLFWVIKNDNELRSAINENRALFGTLDSWVLYRLRQGNDLTKRVEHISDITSCTATGFFDPFTISWAGWALKLFKIPMSMLPRVVENSYDFGVVDKSIFGAEIKISASMGDQSASMWGSGCFKNGDVKITLGTGSFLDLNTGTNCLASVHGLYPLVSWKWKQKNSSKIETNYCMEGAVNDTGSIIKWAIDFGLFDDPALSSDMAETVNDTDGVYFVPAFSGLGPPINDHQATTGIIGIRPSTTKNHIVRAILESIAFRVAQLYNCTLEETDIRFSLIRVDGGVSKNNFICQLLADITGLHVERQKNTELSALGAAFQAGLNAGIWKNREDILNLNTIDRTFIPRKEMKEKTVKQMRKWEIAVGRMKGWYEDENDE